VLLFFLSPMSCVVCKNPGVLRCGPGLIYCSSDCIDTDVPVGRRVGNTVEVDFLVNRKDQMKGVSALIQTLDGMLPEGVVFGGSQAEPYQLENLDKKADSFLKSAELAEQWERNVVNNKLDTKCRLRRKSTQTKESVWPRLAARTKQRGVVPRCPPSQAGVLDSISYTQTPGKMVRDVLYLVVQKFGNMGSIDWSVVQALQTSGRRVTIAIMHSQGTPTIDLLNHPRTHSLRTNAIYDPNKKRHVLAYELDPGFVDENGKSVRSILELLSVVDADAPDLPTLSERDYKSYSIMQKFNSRGAIVRLEVSERPILAIQEERLPLSRTLRLLLPRNLSLDKTAEGIASAIVRLGSMRFDEAERSADEMLPRRRRKSQEMLELDEHWHRDELQEAATLCRAMMLSKDLWKFGEAWVWLWHRLLSWKVTSSEGRNTYVVQTRTDGRLVNFLRLVEIPYGLLMGKEQTTPRRQFIEELLEPIWPFSSSTKTSGDVIYIPFITWELRQRNLTTGSQEFNATRLLRRTQRFTATERPGSSAPVRLEVEELDWTEDLPSDTPL